ncbi:MAG: EI24 domain-containing protein [Burkholderiaceae bacterium]
MRLLLDAFWRAAAYCLHPRVIGLSMLPLGLMVLLAVGLGYFYWDAGVQWVLAWMETASWLSWLWAWLKDLGFGDVTGMVAPLLVVLLVTPMLVVVVLLIVALFMMPTLVSLVTERRFAHLERKKGGSLLASLAWSLGSTLLAGIALVVSMPLWLVPPLVLILPPLIWGWLTYRVMAFDALAEHATRDERAELFRRHRGSLLLIGVLTGYMGAAPSLVWASGVVFLAAFYILIPIAIWIYTLVFAFSALWFTHFCLAALERLRAESPPGDVFAPSAVVADDVGAARAALPAAAPSAPAGPPALPSNQGPAP